MWGINIAGPAESLTEQLAASSAQLLRSDSRLTPWETTQVQSAVPLLEKVIEDLPPAYQAIVSASGRLGADDGELRIVVTYSPAPLPVPVSADDLADGSISEPR